ncbi:NfeD family protein [Dietzia sp.]|uniref:NfeD family protein n=1 Tax=Dietzia sp. TaxID=1871616 RepID=UPI002FDA52FE
MPALIWLAGAGLLALAETASGDLFLLMLAGGALGGAGAAALGAPIWLQGIVFAIVSIVLVLGVRPLAKSRLLAGTGAHTNVDALTGREAEITGAISGAPGLVTIGGDEWTARALVPGEEFAVGEHVWIHEIDGATAIVAKKYV